MVKLYRVNLNQESGLCGVSGVIPFLNGLYLHAGATAYTRLMDVPDIEFAGYPASLKTKYRISGNHRIYSMQNCTVKFLGQTKI